MRTPISIALAATLAGPVLAEAPSPLSPVLVTATRSPQPLDQSLASAVVFDREAIERSQALDLVELLRHAVGVEISRNGGPGGASTVFLRGANSNQTLVLVDGVRVSSVTTGAAAWEQLPLDQVERVEIVRGPRAALWGSDAIGGVVQIFTRVPDGGSARLSAGRYADYFAGVGIGGRSGNLTIGGSAGRRTVEGFSAQNANGFGFDPDDDGYRYTDLSFGLDWQDGESILSLRSFSRDGEIEFDQGDSEAINRGASLSWQGTAGAWRPSLQLGWSMDDVDTPAFGSVFETRRWSADLSAERAIGEQHQLTLLANLLNESGRYGDAFAGDLFDQDRGALALAGLWQWRLGAHRIEAALRVDDYDGFGSEWSPRLGWSWELTPNLRLISSAGEGFRAPNFNELYFPGFGGQFAGDPNLDPERSQALELRAEWRAQAQWRWALSTYRNDVEDLIAFAGVDFQAINIARARLQGVELEGRWDGEATWVEGSMAWQNPLNRDTDQILPRRAKRNAHLAAGWAFDDSLALGAEIDYASRRFDFGQPLDAYSLLALTADWRLNPDWRVQLRGDNLTDEDYELASGFNTPGRSLSVTLRWGQ
ncbi:MAG: TonB-dependent receptor [Xanthomonadales bacterium]|nr:TonB-dependent receptor [Xanthomonadales bacterium]